MTNVDVHYTPPSDTTGQMPLRRLEVRHRNRMRDLSQPSLQGRMMRHHKHPFVYPGDWVERAECSKEDPRMFYPPDDKPVPRDFYAKAKAVCHRCPVKPECLKYGENEPYGVWGMTTPVERTKMRDRKAERHRTMIENPLRQEAVGE